MGNFGLSRFRCKLENQALHSQEIQHKWQSSDCDLDRTNEDFGCGVMCV